MYCSLNRNNNIHTSREFKVLKARDSYIDKSKYVKKYYKNKFKELNLIQEKSSHQKSKYEKLNNALTKRNTSKEDIIILDESSDIDFSYIIESNHSSPETGKTSISYDSDSADNDKSSNNSIISEDNNLTQRL